MGEMTGSPGWPGKIFSLQLLSFYSFSVEHAKPNLNDSVSINCPETAAHFFDIFYHVILE